MPKTYGTVTTFTAGSVLTAAQLNVASTAINNLVVPPACRVTRTTAQTITTSTWSFISFTSMTFDTDGMTAVTDTKVTVQTAGLYLISAYCDFGATATGNRYVRIEKNAATSSNGTGLAQNTTAGIATNALGQTVTTIASLSASDTVHLSVYQTSGGNTNTSIDLQPFLAMTWIGRTS